MSETPGERMHRLATELFPICRSLTGAGVRQTLDVLERELPGLVRIDVPSGTKCFDWEVPAEWNIRDGYVADLEGNRVVDFQRNNLHVVGYSTPIDQEVEWDELNSHLFSLPEQPSAIPYVTSYYKPFWGFCISHEARQRLKPGRYRVKIDSTLTSGVLNYAELILPGRTDREVLLSTYVCHPSMANNELSGPVLAVGLAKWLLTLPERRYTYRIVFVPETIGAVVYLSRNLEAMKRNTHAGFVLTCVGDERAFSYLPSRYGSTISDRVAVHVLGHRCSDFVRYTFLDRGSDERQYCSPGVDLPVASVMRTKYGKFPEYHTSLDDLKLVTAIGLGGTYDVYTDMITLLEANRIYQTTTPCEPQLGKRGLYPNLSIKKSGVPARAMMDFLAYADGTNDLIGICDRIGVYAPTLLTTLEKLSAAGLLRDVTP